MDLYATGTETTEAARQGLERLLETAVVVAAVATIPLTVAQEQGVRGSFVTFADWAVWAVFLADYGILMALASDRRGFAKRNWLSAAVIVLSFPIMPSLLALVRLARLARLLRLLRLVGITARGLGALRLALGRPGLVYVSGATSILVLAGGAVLTLLEPKTVDGNFWNGVWWAIVTTTTVGYGDIAPVTLEGRLLGIALMLTGVGLVATLAASIAAYFVKQDCEQEDAELRALAERLDRIEDLLRQSQHDSRGETVTR